MADDQGPKIASIDELVNELTKKNSSPPTPPPSGGPAPSAPPKPLPPEISKPKFTPPSPSPAMPRPITPSMSSGPSAAPAPMPAPATPAPKPPAPPVGQTPSPAPVKEYQSSIRTMKDDIATLKQGQKPAGVDVPRIIQPPALPSAPKPSLPTGGPGQQFKMPSVSMGQAEKTGPLPPMPTGKQAVREPILPPTGRPAPIPPMPTGRQEKPQIYAPPLPTGKTSAGKNRLFILIAGVVVLFGVLYWFLVLRVPEPEIVIETPTPSPVATPVAGLEELFGVSQLVVAVDPANPADSFSKALNSVIVPIIVDGGKFIKIALKDLQGGDLSWLNLVSVPQQTLDSLGGEAVVLAYGQKEIFNQSGQLNTTAPVGTRAVIVAEVKDASSASQGIAVWEPTMTEAFRQLFGLNLAQQQPDPNFLNMTYQGAAVRFRNFPYPDQSIDVGVISATNGKSYLVIADSRESMFAAIDILKGTR